MKIKSFEVKNFGNVENFKCEFNRQVTVFDEKEYESLLAALGLATLNAIFYSMCAEKIQYGKDTFISGVFDFSGDEYRAEYFYSETLKKGDFCVDENLCGRLYKNGKTVDFADYYKAFLTSFVDNKVFWHNNDISIMPNVTDGFNWGRDDENICFFARGLLKAKTSYNTHYSQKLKEFVQAFKPIFIKDCIDYKMYLHFDDNNCFECIRHYEDGTTEKDKYLSAKDKTLFNFSCFSVVASFMQEYNASLNRAKKPVFLFCLLGQIGVEIDASAVLNQVAKTGCNIFVFEPFGMFDNQTGISEFQFVKPKLKRVTTVKN